DQGRGRRRP
nr:Chain D, ASP-GLN-GLY-ARG-GLY-ARG-ARG-ARG-PRO [Drosophila melanogaster]